MSTGWTLFFLAASYMLAGYMIRWAQTELAGRTNWWMLPYRERCRRYRPALQCKNRVWRIRWSARAPLSAVCRECRRADERNAA